MIPRVAISSDFFRAYSKLPKKAQKKAREFTEKFRRDPTAASINYESIHGMRDEKVRTVRIGLDYRAIVVHPPRGDVYLCVWVDHHDEAMDWARNKRFEVNPRVGSLQVYEVKQGTEQPVTPPDPQERVAEGRLLAGTAHDDLLLCGVPEMLLPSVTALRTDADLDELAPYLPAEAADALYLLAAGGTVDDAFAELDRPAAPPAQVDPEDFAAALALDESKQTFLLVDDDEELAAMLSAPLEQWRVFLHPSQRRIVRARSKGEMKVTGGAGTGKTVVLMHRAAWLAREVFTGEDDRLLVTTFTRNLALDIKENLAKLCPDVADRIEVTHLHGWAMRFLRQEGAGVRIAEEPVRARLWDEAYHAEDQFERPLAFFKEEFAQVVQAQAVRDRRDYLRASRAGRGTPLQRKERAQVWTVLARYRRLLDAEGLAELTDATIEARHFIDKHPGRLAYRAVLADEVQDFGPPELRLLRAIVPEGPNDLFLAGDAHQRIYRRMASMSRCGINVRGRRSRRLRVNYRTTESIKRWSVALLKGCDIDDLDGGAETLSGYRSLRDGPAPEVRHFASADEEGRAIVNQINAWRAADIPAEEICISARTNALVKDRYLPLLEQAGIPAVKVDKDHALPTGAVRVATMHRLKGLEFPRMILAAVHGGMVPLALGPDALGDEASRRDHEKSERCLLYVAATRARDALVVTGFGQISPLVG